MNMYIIDTSWILLNIPEPNKYTKIHQLGEINKFKFINYMEEKQEDNSVSNKLLLNEEKNIIYFSYNDDDIQSINIDAITGLKKDIDKINIYDQNYELNENNQYYIGNIIDGFC